MAVAKIIINKLMEIIVMIMMRRNEKNEKNEKAKGGTYDYSTW